MELVDDDHVEVIGRQIVEAGGGQLELRRTVAAHACLPKTSARRTPARAWRSGTWPGSDPGSPGRSPRYEERGPSGPATKSPRAGNWRDEQQPGPRQLGPQAHVVQRRHHGLAGAGCGDGPGGGRRRSAPTAAPGTARGATRSGSAAPSDPSRRPARSHGRTRRLGSQTAGVRAEVPRLPVRLIDRPHLRHHRDVAGRRHPHVPLEPVHPRRMGQVRRPDVRRRMPRPAVEQPRLIVGSSADASSLSGPVRPAGLRLAAHPTACSRVVVVSYDTRTSAPNAAAGLNSTGVERPPLGRPRVGRGQHPQGNGLAGPLAVAAQRIEQRTDARCGG